MIAMVRWGVILLACSAARAQSSFVNFETPHVHPMAMTPDGARLLVVNTADDNLEVFDAGGSALFWGWLNLRINLASNWGSALIFRSSVDPYVPPIE